MHGPIRAISASSIAAALALLAAGCTSIDPERFVPPPAASAATAQRLDGSVNVQAYTLAISQGFLVLGEAGGLEPTRAPRGRVAMYPGATLRTALEKAIAQQGLFSRTAPANADYVLDVWVIDAVRTIKTLGEGFAINVTALWRLTRVSDGAVIWVDFAVGRGASHGVGTNAYVHSLEDSTRAMIADGLLRLSRRSHSASAAAAAVDWPSTAPETPAGLRRMRAGWSNLRAGMAEAEVRKLLVPAVPAEPITGEWSFIYESGGGKPAKYESKDLEVFQPPFPFYTLSFLNGRLQRAELHW